MQYTTNFSLRKPQLLESANVADLNANADSIDTLLYQNRHISATDYNQNTSYAVGDLVIYENLFYKCTGATSGNWDSSKWVRTTLAAEVELAGQSGGSVVEGNPSGTATAQLEKLGIDNDIFFINDASKVIAEPYDSTATYAVGDYCIYNTLLYKCTTAVSTAEAFDSTKWTACLVTDEMGSGGGGSAELNEVTMAQYDALTEAQKKNGEMYFIKDVNGDGSQFQPVIYSTEEREIGVWTDGRPLYQKTVSTGGSAPSGTTLVERIVQTSVDTIRYTKNADAVGSGTWTPQGVPAHHYSLNEQAVGTWYDGSTLYEKTLIITNIPNSNITDTAHGISNLDTIISATGTVHTIASVDSNNTFTSIPRIQDNAGNAENMAFEINKTNVRLKGRGKNFASLFDKVIIVMRYTKSS